MLVRHLPIDMFGAALAIQAELQLTNRISLHRNIRLPALEPLR